MKRFLRWTVVVVLISAVVVSILYLTRTEPVRVIAWRAKKGTVEATVSNTRAGTVKACRRAKLAPPTGGQVAALPVKEGQRVRSGQVLLELWNKDLKAQVDLASSEALAARARAEEACLLAKLAERDAARLKTLREEGVASEEGIDRAVADAEAKAAGCRASHAATEVSDSKLAVAKANLERTILRAPFDGIVAQVDAELGEYVTPSPPGIPTPPAVDLIEEECLYVRAPLDEVDAPRVRPGMTARVSLDAYPGKSFPGKVRRVAAYVLDREKQSRTVDVDVELTNTKDISNLLPGYSADVEVLLEAQESVLRVPSEALLEGNQVLVYVDGVLESRQIKTGISNWRFTEVIEGLQEGDLVVTSLNREGVTAQAPAVLEESQEETP